MCLFRTENPGKRQDAVLEDCGVLLPRSETKQICLNWMPHTRNGTHTIYPSAWAYDVPFVYLWGKVNKTYSGERLTFVVDNVLALFLFFGLLMLHPST